MPGKSLAALNAEVTRILGDSTRTIWSSAEVDRYIQQGYNQFCLDTELLWRRYELGDVADQATYTVPTELYKLERVEWNNYRIPPLTSADLENRYPAFESQTGPARGYTASGDGLRTIRRVPAAAASDLDILVLEYTRRGATLSTSQGVELPDRYAAAVRFFALYRCWEREGDGQDPKLALHFKTRYDDAVRRAVLRRGGIRSKRVGQFGPGVTQRFGPPPPPQLPWNFGYPVTGGRKRGY